MGAKLILALYLAFIAVCLSVTAPFVPWSVAQHFSFGITLVLLELAWAPRWSPIQAFYWVFNYPHRLRLRLLEERERKYGRTVWMPPLRKKMDGEDAGTEKR